MKNKKGFELSMNLIIIAVISLIVLIVIVLIFTGQVSKWRAGMNNSQSQYTPDKCKIPATGRSCMGSASCEQAGGMVYPKPSGGWSDCFFGQECCSVGG